MVIYREYRDHSIANKVIEAFDKPLFATALIHIGILLVIRLKYLKSIELREVGLVKKTFISSLH